MWDVGGHYLNVGGGMLLQRDWLIRLLAFISGSGSAYCFVAVQIAALATISSADTGRAAALFQTQNQVAGAIGVTVLVTVVTSSSPAGTTGAALIPAFHHAFLTAAAVAAIGTLIALTIHDTDAAPAMRPRETPVPHPPQPATPIGRRRGHRDARITPGRSQPSEP